MNGGSDLRGESEVGSCSLLFCNHDPEFIHNPSFANPPKRWAYKSIGNHFRLVSGEEFRNAGDAVADNVVEQLSRKSPHPMVLISQKCPRIAGIREIVAVVT